MPADEFLEIYPSLMKDLSQGFALYKPWESKWLKPGMCGFFDAEGDWNTIVDITQISGTEGEYSPLEGSLDSQTAGTEDWAPVCSQGAKYASAKQEFASNIPGTPADVGLKLDFTSSKNKSAALIAAPVVKFILAGEDRFHKWCKANSAAILRNHGEDIKNYGLWIVRKTCCTPRCSIAVWKGKSQKVSIGLSLDAMNAGKVTGSGSWGEMSKVGTWRDIPAPGQDPKNFVIFIGGLKYKYRTINAGFGFDALSKTGVKSEVLEEPLGYFRLKVTAKDNEQIFDASLDEDWDIAAKPPPVSTTKETEAIAGLHEGREKGPEESAEESSEGRTGRILEGGVERTPKEELQKHLEGEVRKSSEGGAERTSEEGTEGLPGERSQTDGSKGEGAKSTNV